MLLSPLADAHSADPRTAALAENATTERTAPDLAKTERDLLKLLADGATDEAAARSLGISPRTVRRHVAALMTRLNAVSRFQAGAEAARRGWLA